LLDFSLKNGGEGADEKEDESGQQEKAGICHPRCPVSPLFSSSTSSFESNLSRGNRRGRDLANLMGRALLFFGCSAVHLISTASNHEEE
jgi:hypothetical protein